MVASVLRRSLTAPLPIGLPDDERSMTISVTQPRETGASPRMGTNGRRSGPKRDKEQPQATEMTWRRMDLHLHTPASSDYQEPHVSPLQILQKAEERGLDILAFTDHNSVRGYANLWREIEDLELLEYLERLQPQEAERLQEYRRLLGSMLVLPGFEFTATFGFHILAIFPEPTSVRLMEHVLMLLGVPEDRFGSGEVGATTDVLRAYEVLSDHGALVIGAHANSTHGVAMQGLRFGGQTKIAYTQDEHLHALEVTDLALGAHRRSTARFFNGTKPEYPRRMHCIQGSDAHRLDRDPQRDTNLGIGDRATEVLLPTITFAALKSLFLGDDFARTRPYFPESEIADVVKEARAEGNTAVQAFHESFRTKRTGVSHLLKDVVAFANTDGGTVFVGASPFEKRSVVGVPDPEKAIAELQREVATQITPAPEVETEVLESDGKSVLVIRVSPGAEKPYALAPGAIYVRRGGESAQAHRDEIVAMVRGVSKPASPAVEPEVSPGEDGRSDPDGPGGAGRRNGRRRGRRPLAATVPLVPESPQDPSFAVSLQETSRQLPTTAGSPAVTSSGLSSDVAAEPIERLEEVEEDAPHDDIAPGNGVEVIDAYQQDGITYFTMHDLRHHKYVHNVTADTPKRLWRYAISQRAAKQIEPGHVRWKGDFGFLKSHKPRGGEQRYNLVYRGDGDLRVFYGVSEEGLDDTWRTIIPDRRATAD